MADQLDANRTVCADCVGEPFLRSEIKKHGHKSVCSYCNEEGTTFSIGQLADHCEYALDRHFYRTATEPGGLEWAMIKEGDLDWERKGEPILDLIQNEAHVEYEIAEDVQRVLHQRHRDIELERMGEELPFEEDAHYAEREVDDSDSQASWFHFEQGLKTEARFFNRSAEWTLQSIFDGIGELKTHDNRPIVVEAGPKANIKAIYRARVFQSEEKLEQALMRPDKEVGPPTSRLALAGRMNSHGISVFYGATNPMVALAEVRPPIASKVVIGRFEFVNSVRLLDVEALRELNVEGSVFDRSYAGRLEKAKFLGWLSQRIATPVLPDDEAYEYLPTQVIADYLATNANPLLHGILYRSVQGANAGLNVVLFHKAARVQPLDIPDGTEIHASLYDHNEDGWEPNYSVWEETPPALPPDSRDLENFLLSEPLDRPLESDSRNPYLKLDLASIEVHHVDGVDFRTEKFPVRRYRIQQHNPKS